MDLAQAMRALEAKGKPSTKRIYMRHGATEPLFGVSVADMKAILKQAGRDHSLALRLYDTRNGDAQYLAGLMADAEAMTRRDLERWARTATWYMVREYSVAGVAADGPHGWSMGSKWIDARDAGVQTCGWASLSGCLATRPDAELDLDCAGELLQRVAGELHGAENRVRHAMNGFVIAAGAWVPALRRRALAVAKALGKVEVDMGGTACRVPDAAQAIAKAASRPTKKRASARC
jgi:3-methyladenine DNA glycosylase AlkD